MSVRKAFEDEWHDKFPDTPVPTNLSFLDEEGVASLGSALDSAERIMKKLESELSRQQFIYDFVLQQLNALIAARSDHAARRPSQHGAAGDDERRKTPVTKTPSAPRPSTQVRGKASQLAAVMAKIGLGNKTSRPAIDPEDEVSLLDDGGGSSKKATPLSRFYQKSNMYRATSEPSLLDCHMKFKPQPAIPPSTAASRMPPGFKPVFTRDGDTSRLSVTTVNPCYMPGGGPGSLYSVMRKSTGSDLDREHRHSQIVEPPVTRASDSYLETDLDSVIPPMSASPPPRPPPPGEAFRLDVTDGPGYTVLPQKPRSNIYEEPMEFRRETPSTDTQTDDADDEGASSDEEPIYFNMLLFNQQTLSRANALYTSAEEIETTTLSSVEREKSASEKRRLRRMEHHYEHIEPQLSKRLSIAPCADYGKQLFPY